MDTNEYEKTTTTTNAVRDREGIMKADPIGVHDRWKSYFSCIFSVHQDSSRI